MMYKIHRKVHDLSGVADHLRPTVKILLDHQDILSDGYGHYCEYFASEQAHERHNDDLVVGALEEIARQIFESKTDAETPLATLDVMEHNGRSIDE